MILSSGRVVGNVNPVGEQWKEVRDNRVKKNGNQVVTGKEIVPVDQGNGQQVQRSVNLIQNDGASMQEIGPANGNSQQSNDNGRRQIVPVNADQQIQTANKFAALQVKKQNNEGNQ